MVLVPDWTDHGSSVEAFVSMALEVLLKMAGLLLASALDCGLDIIRQTILSFWHQLTRSSNRLDCKYQIIWEEY